MIHVHKAGVMQHLAQYAARGYVYHFQGCVSAARIGNLVSKFEREYSINRNKDHRYRQKKLGRANAIMIAHPIYQTMNFCWIVALTEGSHRAFELEQIQDARQQRERLQFLDRFEMYRQPRTGGKISWSWRLSQQEFADYKTGILTAIRNRSDDRELIRIGEAIQKLPGFRGIRSHAYELMKFIEMEWKRSRNDQTCPVATNSVSGYLRFIEQRMVSLELVIERMSNGLTPFDPNWVYDNRSNPVLIE